MKSMRFSTLVKRCGMPVRATKLSKTEWDKAVAEGRFMTVYHGEYDWCTPLEAHVRKHGSVNTVCKLVTPLPIPEDVERIIGMRNNDDAWKAIEE